MADARDLKSRVRKGRAGSSPASAIFFRFLSKCFPPKESGIGSLLSRSTSVHLEVNLGIPHPAVDAISHLALQAL